MDSSGTKQPRGALLVSNLPSLQNLLKRDPKAYREDFLLQWNQYLSLQKIVELGLDTTTTQAKARETEARWRELVGFVAQVAHLYPDVTQAFPQHLSTLLLQQQNTALSPETRKTLIQSLVLLRNRDMLPSLDLLKILFPLLGVTSSPNLRSFILKTILTDIKLANKKSKNHKLNRTVQGLLFSMVERGVVDQQQQGQNGGVGGPEGTGSRAGRKMANQGTSTATTQGREAMLAVKICSELWRKNIWNDSKTVQLVSLACFHAHTKVASAAMHFFLATEDDQQAEDSEDEAEEADLKQMYHQSTINKSRRSTVKKEKRQVKANHAKRKRNEAKKAGQANFAALHLLLDPQSFAERLYDHLVRFDKQYTLEHRVLMMQLFGRVTGTHQCVVLGFYSYATRFLTHHQPSVTAILVAVASSVHELTPPDVITPVIRKLAAEFIHPGVGAEVIAAGLNAVREVCRRQPLGMERELLEDLVEYKKSKDKGIMMASRSLLQLYREVDPSLLKRRERGKVASMSGADRESKSFGQVSSVSTGIQGLELLAKHKAERGDQDGAADDAAAWDVQESDSGAENSDEEGWIAVSSDDDQDIVISGDEESDSEDEDDDAEGSSNKKRKKKQRRTRKGKQAATEESDSDSDAPEDESEDEAIKFNLIDDDDDDDESGDEDDEDVADEVSRLQELATQQILTPADFAKINQLETAAAEEASKNGSSAARRRLAALNAAKNALPSSEFLTEGEILGARRKAKMDYAERMAHIQAGREGREKFGSSKGKKKNEKAHSTTNEEKKRTKNFLMSRNSKSVRTKKAASLKDNSKRLRGHKVRQKKKMK